jgi:hypothetical protein
MLRKATGNMYSFITHAWITIEPILKFRIDDFFQMLRICRPAQVNIGADSGSNRLPEPSGNEVEKLLKLLAPHSKIHLKNKLRRKLPESRFYGNV